MGHAYSSMLLKQYAQKIAAKLLLRIEDIDTTRCRDSYTQSFYEDLKWLGFHWDEPPRIQSEHMHDYQKASQKLQDMGLLYPCFCTRKQVAAAAANTDPEGAHLYAGTCRNLSTQQIQNHKDAGTPYCLRLDMQKALEHVADTPLTYKRFSLMDETLYDMEAEPARWGDVIIVRKETPTSYHLSVVVDDTIQGITHVIRGCDLFDSTDIHVLLNTLLDLPTPLYHHHTIITHTDGTKLSKTLASTPLRELREQGQTPDDIIKQLDIR